jgi:hypothetical protein
MANLMDKATFNIAPSIVSQSNPLMQMYQQAMQNPNAFIEQIKRNNPQAYQRAMQLANFSNPKQVVIQMLQERGLNPSMFNLSNI